jgi:hypothetical protein
MAFPAQKGNTMSLVKSPQELQKSPIATLIQIGLAEPLSPWAWLELQNRAKAGRITKVEADQIMRSVTAWMRSQYPQGDPLPLNTTGDLFDELNGMHLLAETNVLDFLETYGGNLSLDPLPRLRENESMVRLRCNWRSPWFGRGILGFQFLNEMRSISFDGRQVVASNSAGTNWSQWQYDGALALPPLTPGKHIVRCEIESALIPVADLTGLPLDTASKDWPPAKRLWTRVCDGEFMVYARDSEIVTLTNDPALEPVAHGALSVRQIIIRHKGDHLAAVASFELNPQPGLPVSVDVRLRLAGEDFKCGRLFADKTPGRGAYSPKELTADIGSLDLQIKEGEIRLLPDPQAAEAYPGIDRIWGKEVVVGHVPLLRQDLSRADSVEATNDLATNASFARPAFGPVQEHILPDFAAINLASGQVKALPKSVIEQDRFAGNKDAAFAWMENERLDIINFGDAGLDGEHVTLHTRTPDDWENYGAEPLTESLLGQPTWAHYILEPKFLNSATNYTAAFKTRDDRLGLLQISSYSGDPEHSHGAKIRYKLVQMP